MLGLKRVGSMKITRFVFTVMLALGVSSCGGTNNDQGVTFTLLGFFGELPDTGECGEIPAGLVGTGISLGDALTESGGRSDLVAVIGLQNNLNGQILSVDSLTYEFFVPGASIQPPETISALPMFLGPAVVEGATGGGEEGGGAQFDSSLPDSFGNDGICNVGFSEFLLLPSSVRTFLSFNRGSLPEPPFDMLVTVRASGQTSAGDRLTSNPETIFVTILPETVIEPTQAEEEGGVDGAIANDAELDEETDL